MGQILPSDSTFNLMLLVSPSIDRIWLLSGCGWSYIEGVSADWWSIPCTIFFLWCRNLSVSWWFGQRERQILRFVLVTQFFTVKRRLIGFSVFSMQSPPIFGIWWLESRRRELSLWAVCFVVLSLGWTSSPFLDCERGGKSSYRSCSPFWVILLPPRVRLCISCRQRPARRWSKEVCFWLLPSWLQGRCSVDKRLAVWSRFWVVLGGMGHSSCVGSCTSSSEGSLCYRTRPCKGSTPIRLCLWVWLQSIWSFPFPLVAPFLF